MRVLSTPNGDSDRVVDIFTPGEDYSYEIEAGVPLKFPVAADCPQGGAFYIRVPAGADVCLHTRPGSPGYPLDGLAHWPLAYDVAEAVELRSAAGTTIHVLQHAEKA